MLDFFRVLVIAGLSLAALGVSPAKAATEADLRDCDGNDVERKLAGCAALINDPRLPPKLRATAFYLRGFAHLARQDYERAIADTKAASALRPDDVAYYNQLGILFSKVSDHKSSIAAYDKAISIAPSEPDPYYGRGLAHRQLSDFASAIADYSKAVELGPRAGGTLNIDTDKVRAVARDRVHADFYVGLATTYDVADDHARAVATYNEAARKFPDVGIVYAKRGASLASHGDTTGGLADFNKALALNSADTEVMGLRGMLQFNLGNFADAARDFEKARAIERNSLPVPPEYAAIWVYLAQMRGRGSLPATPDPATALAASKAPATAWPAPVQHLLLGLVTPDALLAAVKNADERCEAHFYIGQRLFIDGDRRGGMAALKAAVETCPKSFSEFTSADAELKRSLP